jgi:hypothetical protein
MQISRIKNETLSSISEGEENENATITDPSCSLN